MQVHGSAPDIAGQDKANPMAMVLSAAMMCRYGLSLPKVCYPPASELFVCADLFHLLQASMPAVFMQVADHLEQAVTAALDAGYRTGDLMSSGMKQVGCVELGDILAKQITGNKH